MNLLTVEQKTLLKEMKSEWKERIPEFSAIYCDKRKTFYKVKLYLIPKKYMNRAKNIAEKYNLGDIEVSATSSYLRTFVTYYDCVVRIPYV